jgi:deoxycytidylate deaminase
MNHHNLTAIIYDKRGNVLSIGKNSYTKTHPLQAQFAKQAGEDEKIFLHAEIDAIIKCQNISKAHKISIFRVARQGGYALAKPCKICQTALSKTPIKIIEHT